MKINNSTLSSFYSKRNALTLPFLNKETLIYIKSQNIFKTNYPYKAQMNFEKIFQRKHFLNSIQKNNLNKFYFANFSTGNKHVDKDGFPIPEKRDLYDEDDMIINIGEKERFKGMLIICPTPLGNINDISIRQFEAMKNGDILACEDSRKTGKLLEFIQLKKMKEKFYAEFGISFEEFVNMGGLNMTDEQIREKILNKEKENNNSFKQNSTQKHNPDKKDENVYYTEEIKVHFINFLLMHLL